MAYDPHKLSMEKVAGARTWAHRHRARVRFEARSRVGARA